MNNFWKKHQEYLILFFYLAIVGALIWLVIKPLIGEINANADEVQKKIVEQENNKNKFKEMPKLKVQFENILIEEKKLCPLFKKDQAVELIEKIENIADETNNKINIEIIEGENKKKTNPSSVSKGKEEEKNLIANLPSKNYLEVKINLSGLYGDLVSFIEKIENIEYPSDITTISIFYSEENEFQIESNAPFKFDTIIKEDKLLKKNNDSEMILKAILNIVFYLQDEKS